MGQRANNTMSRCLLRERVRGEAPFPDTNHLDASLPTTASPKGRGDRGHTP